MFDGGAVPEVEFEADEIDVFSELGINSNTKQNETFNDRDVFNRNRRL